MSDSSKSQAKAQVESIVEMVAALNCDYDRLAELRETYADLQSEAADDTNVVKDEAQEALKEWEEDYLEELNELLQAAGDFENEDDASQRIDEYPLSIQVRSGWVTPGEEMEAEDFEILLCTGGPAVRIIGALDQYHQPESAHVEHNDWYEPWSLFTETTEEQDEAILAYCSHFYFGG